MPARTFCASSMMSIGAVGAGDDELAVLELDVAGRGFERVRGDLLALLDHLGATASTMAWPEFIIEREPPVPPPASSSSLSPCSSRTLSNGTPSFSLSTCANGVAWPWP